MNIGCSIVEDILDEEDLISGISRAFTKSEIHIKKSDSIIIKPNLCYYWDASTGQTTSPQLVGALIEFIRNRLGNDPEILIGEADASAMKTKHAFRMLGYEDLAKEKEVELINLSNKPVEEMQTKVGSSDMKLSFSKKLLDTNIIINVPKLKYHRLPKVTCAMKNIFGAIAKPHKYSYHSNLSKVIVAANKIIQSDLILVDGLVGLGEYPKIMKTLLIGQDVLSVDSACSRIMGFKPGSVEYLKIAKMEKMWAENESKIVGEASLEELKRSFPSVNYQKQRIIWGLQLWMVNTYSKIVGDTVPPMLVKE